ncbi:MAG: MEMO1 family protein [Candidatus Bathyarchaeia archaeon]|nr:MEMO1 family protein [Candidatus Bathyarchaeota archaeon]
MSAKVRYARYAGSFYAGSRESLRRQIEECFTHRFGPGGLPKVSEDGPRRIIGLVCPHAGYMYSGPVAANAYYRLALDGRVDIFVILGPNHQGIGSGVAIMDRGVWRTPLGDVEIDPETAREILRHSTIIDVDDSAHLYEHSIEVQIPFLQYVYGQTFKFVPICFLMQDLETSRDVGQALAEALRGKNAVIIASTDLTHYEPHKRASEKDREAIDAILKLDEELFYSVIESRNVTACGYGPVAALIAAAKKLGANRAELLSYKTSGDITGDLSAVVGYAAIALSG